LPCPEYIHIHRFSFVNFIFYYILYLPSSVFFISLILFLILNPRIVYFHSSNPPPPRTVTRLWSSLLPLASLLCLSSPICQAKLLPCPTCFYIFPIFPSFVRGLPVARTWKPNTSETSVSFYQNTRRNIPEESHLCS
jgi:hypothetical protein